MRRILILAVIIAGVLVLFFGAVGLKIRSGRPEVLLERLRTARGAGRGKLVMGLKLTRGDVVGPMIEAFRDGTGNVEYRCVLLELLFGRNLRQQDDRIGKILHEAIESPEAAIRLGAVNGFSVYGSHKDRIAFIDYLIDPDGRVRKQAYILFSSAGRPEAQPPPLQGVWLEMDVEQREKVVELARSRLGKESDPELAYLVRAVIGRAVAVLCDKSREALLKADIVGAERLLKKAMELDPENQRVQIRYVRTLLSTGETDRALKMAEEYGALLRVPRLLSVPVIDGDPTDEAWDGAFQDERFYLTCARWASKRAESRSRMYVGHRDGRIYVALFCYEDDLKKLRVKAKPGDKTVWQDDCVELFFDPKNTENRFFQFIVNPAGVLQTINKGSRKTVKCEYAAKVFYDRGYWGCEFSVAAQEMDGEIGPDSIWGLDIMRTRIGAASEQCAWWPTFGFSHYYHLYPIAVFEDAE